MTTVGWGGAGADLKQAYSELGCLVCKRSTVNLQDFFARMWRQAGPVARGDGRIFVFGLGRNLAAGLYPELRWIATEGRPD